MNHERFHILEPRITSPLQKESEYVDQGVALIIINTAGKLLLVEEAFDDPPYGRFAGQKNIITETREPGERIKPNIERAIAEELGSNYSQFTIIEGSYRETNGLYTQRMGYRYKYRCVCFMYNGNPDVPANEQFRCDSGEISDFQWISPDDIDEFDIEPGARLVIEYYKNYLLQ
jgi:hypothetical protein